MIELKRTNMLGYAHRFLMTFGLFLLLIIGTSLLAQEKKAVELFEEGRYHSVLDYYTRNYKKGLAPPDLRIFSSSMLHLGLTSDAIDIMQRAYLDHPNDPDIILALTECLIYNQDYASAYYLLEEFDDMEFNREELYALAKQAAILKQWESRESKYDVMPLDGFNTKKNEFALYLKGDKRIFCSSQQKDEILHEEYDKGKKEYTALYEAEGDTTEHKPFSNGRFKGKFNIGPFAYAKDKFYFTYSAEIRPGQNQLQILYCDADNPSLEKSIQVDMGIGDYSMAHPTFSEDGNRMIFSSDVPGGEGGMDLYYSVRTNEGWSSPISLGEVVNTPGNEVFPRLVNGQIYFSSNGHPGYGGLDIFVVSDDMFREDLRNLYAPINSPYDDFGYLRTGESSGYFSSNRAGGKGGDDIYRYDKIKVQPDMRLISGIVEVKGIPQKNVKMLLTDMKGNILEQAYTDINGVFYFNRDPEGGTYNIKMEAEPETVQATDLYLTDQKGRKGNKLKADANGNFTFELLALDDYYLDYIQVQDNTLFAFTLKGQLYKNSPGDLQSNFEIALLDERGIVKKEIESTAHGFFQFNQVVPEERYWFHVKSEEKDLKMAIIDKNDQIIEILEQDENGRFFYDRPFNEGEFISLYNEDMELVTIEKDEAINLPDILYDLNSWELKESSKAELNRLVGILKNNADLKIELSSHTDSRGGARYNEELSSKRAREAWSYIVSHGIDPSRIVAVGKGESSPVNSCKDGVQCRELEHALNRRTEFRILSN
jgi:outer membrane protein OmpA-like peptidoglycan-associated protein